MFSTVIKVVSCGVALLTSVEVLEPAHGILLLLLMVVLKPADDKY